MKVLFVVYDTEILGSPPVNINIKWAVDCQFIYALLLWRKSHIDEFLFAFLAIFGKLILQHCMGHFFKWRAVCILVEINLELF